MEKRRAEAHFEQRVWREGSKRGLGGEEEEEEGEAADDVNGNGNRRSRMPPPLSSYCLHLSLLARH